MLAALVAAGGPAWATDLVPSVVTYTLSQGATDDGYIVGSETVTIDVSVGVDDLDPGAGIEGFDVKLEVVGAILPGPFGDPVVPGYEYEIATERFRGTDVGFVFNFSYTLSGPAFEAYLAPAIQDLQSGVFSWFRVRATVDAANEVTEIDETNNDLLASGNFVLVPLTGTFSFGPVDTALTTIDSDLSVFGLNCGTDLETLAGTTIWSPSVNGLWDDVSIDLTALGSPHCATLARVGDAFDVVASASVTVGPVTGTMGGLDVDIPSVLLDSAGAHPSGPLTLDLPEEHSVHAIDQSNRPVPRGVTTLEFPTLSPSPVTDFQDLTASLSVPTSAQYLQARSLPFVIRLSTVDLTQNVVAGRYTQTRYAYNQFFNGNDRRAPSRRGVTTNDVRFRQALAPIDDSFTMDADGIDLTASFGAVAAGQSAQSHFPRTSYTWGGFDAVVDGGRIGSGQTVPGTGFDYVFVQSADCPDCDSGGKLADTPFVIAPAGAQGMGSDGAILTHTLPIGANPRWGPYDAANASDLFERLDDQNRPGVLYLPGFAALASGGSDDVPVARYLLGTRRALDSAGTIFPAQHYPLGSANSLRGNHFMAGVTVGPEQYSTAPDSLPDVGIGQDLTGSTMRIGFGGLLAPDYHVITNNVGVKYVFRAGGVTGVFNTDTPPQPTVYGYDLALRRFAFRQVANELDTFSFIDGSVYVPFKGDFDVSFRSLALECTGDVGGGVVDREDVCGDGLDDNGNGVADENCDERLAAWKAAMIPLTMEFVPEMEVAACALVDRVLEIGKQTDVVALAKPLGLVAQWTPTGDPQNARVTGSTDNLFDRPQNPASGGEDLGFDVALEETATLATDGTGTVGRFELFGDVGVPFWQAVAAGMRFENQSLTAQEQTVLVREDQFAALDPAQPNSVVKTTMKDDDVTYPDARYEWGTTGFGFTLPIYYQAGNHVQGKKPQFIGVTQEADLVVLEANAGVDFVTPRKTKLSFGASADFERLNLSQINLHVDLSDPDSLELVDDFIETLTGDRPVAGAIGALNDAIQDVNEQAGAALDETLEDALRAALDTAGADAVFEAAADALGQVQALPGLAASAVSDSLSDVTTGVTAPLGDLTDQQALDYYDTAPALIVSQKAACPTPSSFPGPNTALLDDDALQLGEVLSALDAAVDGIDGVAAAADDARTLLADLESDTIGTWVPDALAAIQDIRDYLQTASDIASCDPNLNPLLMKIDEVEQVVDVARLALEAVDLEILGDSLGDVIGVDLEGIQEATKDIRELAAQIASQLADVETALTDALQCDAGFDISADILTKAEQFLADIEAALNQAIPAIQEVVQKLTVDTDGTGTADGGFLAVVETALDDARQPLGQIRALVETAQTVTEDAAACDYQLFALLATDVAIQQALDDQMLAATQNVYRWSNGATSFVADLEMNLRAPIDQAIAQAAGTTSVALASLLDVVPNPSAEELADYTTDFIMNSPIVEAIDEQFQRLYGEVVQDVQEGVMLAFDQVNKALQDLVEDLEDKANEALGLAESAVKDLPIKAAKLDGFAIIQGDELERLHIGAQWTMAAESGDDEESDEKTRNFQAALDVTSWNANGKGQGCQVDGQGLLDAVISTGNLKLKIVKSEVLAKSIYLGFTLEGLAPKGVFGGIFTKGDIEFEAFKIYDVGFAAGVGAIENYLGATAGAKFESIQLSAAFLVGKTCNLDVLKSLDPQVGSFIQFPNGIFNGAYVRGSASIPIITGGCSLTVGAAADVGFWYLVGPPDTIGGLLGGGAYGEVACIGALRGQVTLLAQKAGDVFSFRGEGFGVAGVGFKCEPETWTSVAKSRQNKWCATGDAEFTATYMDGWDIGSPKFSAIH